MANKRPRLENEVAAFASQSREGYFGDATASTDSNAGAEPRIVLGEQFGLQKVGTMDLTKEEVDKQLQGCAWRYKEKVVIVTGGGRGIGEGCVRVFFEAGSHVVVCDRSDDATALVEELNGRKTGNTALFVRTDVSKVDQLENLVKSTVARFGRLDCIVNNAGWHPPPRKIDDFAVEEMQDLVQLNFISVFALCKFAMPHLRKVEGNIINISSLVGVFGQANATTYAATKGAVTSFSKALAIDEAKKQSSRKYCITREHLDTFVEGRGGSRSRPESSYRGRQSSASDGSHGYSSGNGSPLSVYRSRLNIHYWR